MFENYLASNKDFKAIEEGLRVVWAKEMNFVFRKKGLIKKVTVISYDSQNLYFWSTSKISQLKELPCSFKKYKLFKKPHKTNVIDRMQKGWRAGINWKYFKLPKNFRNWYKNPVISGGLMTPFTKIHEKIEKASKSLNPYKSYESYLATIVHEFGHTYYNLHQPWWFSDKRENLNYLKKAQLIYKKVKVDLKKIKIEIPTPFFLSEVFAFCTDYYAASVFWPNHKKNIDIINTKRIAKLISLEKRKNLDIQDSVLGNKIIHNTAAVLGILLLHLYPKTWPQRILNKFIL